LLSAQSPAWATAAKTVRPAVGKSLQAAQKALQAKQFEEAQAGIAKAEAAGRLTPYETYLVLRLKASAAIGVGDYRAALAAYGQVVDSSELPEEEKLPVLDSYAKLAYTAKDYARAANAVLKYRQAGGQDPQTLSLYAQSLFLGGRYNEAADVLRKQIAAAEQRGQRPAETQLQLLANCALKQNDSKAYVEALEKIVFYTPKRDYWLDLIVRTAGQPGFSPKLDLDVYRLRRATGTMERPADYLDAAQLALQAGYPSEAKAFIDEGYRRQVLGTGPDAARQNDLRALVAKKLEEDRATLSEGEAAALAQPNGEALLATGFNLIMYGQAEKGLSLMRQGVEKGGLRSPDHARLQMGYALALTGKKAAAHQVLSGVTGSDGARSIARLWKIQLRHMK